jgi:GC-rich sequence DNA-binding factor
MQLFVVHGSPLVWGPGEYTAERLKELQAGTKQLPASKRPITSSSEAVFKLSGSFKSATAPKDDHFDASAVLVRDVKPCNAKKQSIICL